MEHAVPTAADTDTDTDTDVEESNDDAIACLTALRRIEFRLVGIETQLLSLQQQILEIIRFCPSVHV